MRPITALSVSAIALAVAISAQPASAAVITQISYNVTGGSFGGPNANGAITGGSVTVTLPGPSGVTTTPFWTCGSASGGCGTAAIVLSGLSGYVKALGLPVSWAFISPGFASFRHSSGLSHPMLSGASAPGAAATVNAWQVSFPSGFPVSGVINWTFVQTGPYAFQQVPVHSIQLGQEVRTPIPEPSTASLVGLGVGLLGLVGIGKRRGRRAGR